MTGWTFDYTSLLKVAVLALTAGKAGRSGADAMEDYLRWCWRDFIFSGPCIQFGGLYLSPQRKGRMLKNLRGNLEKALTGIRNAAWDLAYLREWGRRMARQQGSPRFHLLCTLDQALRESARGFLFAGESSDASASRHETWKRVWGERDGSRLLKVYAEIEPLLEDPRRRWTKDHGTSERAETLMHELEAELASLLDRNRLSPGGGEASSGKTQAQRH